MLNLRTQTLYNKYFVTCTWENSARWRNVFRCLSDLMLFSHLVAKSCPTLLRPHGLYPPGSSIHGISQARILRWVAISFSRGSSQPRDQTHIACLVCRFFTTEPALVSRLLTFKLLTIWIQNLHIQLCCWKKILLAYLFLHHSFYMRYSWLLSKAGRQRLIKLTGFCVPKLKEWQWRKWK